MIEKKHLVQFVVGLVGIAIALAISYGVVYVAAQYDVVEYVIVVAGVVVLGTLAWVFGGAIILVIDELT